MARDLFTSSCCGNIVRLADLRGQPIEFRRYCSEPVAIGTKWVCPSCKTAYFAWWNDAVWRGGYDEPTPKFAINLCYYATFSRDKPRRKELDSEPKHLCLDNAEDNQKVL